MMPSAEMMLEAAQKALRDFVAPIVEDQWAASALRSVDVILSHLQARAPIEGPMLHADNVELVALLGPLASELALGDPLSGAIAGFVAEGEPLLACYASVGELAALNERGRQLVDDLLVVCHARTDDAARAVHERLRAYLLRHMERESPLFFPVYVGRPV